MEAEIVYRRKLSGEEALKRYILVLQESLKLFPKPGMVFKIKMGDKEVDAEVKVVEKWNRGARKPAIEYHIDLSRHAVLFRPHYGQNISLKQIKKNHFLLD